MGTEGREGEATAFVSNVQRFCVHDGPGIRTVVFLNGCPLRCAWCQNPEALEGRPVLMHDAERCVGCGACIEACPAGANRREADGRVVLDRALCRNHLDCVAACHYGARIASGKAYTVAALLEEVLLDRVAFRNSGGGVTLSGGEPLAHPAFASAFLEACGREGLHRAVETSCLLPWASLERVLPHVDLFLCDLKLVDAAAHVRWTGSPNASILYNLRGLAETGARIIIRVPLIPGVNDGEAEFGAIARFARDLGGVDELHILPFHQIGSSKYGLVGKEYGLAALGEDNEAGVARCRALALGLGLRVSIGGTGLKNEVDQRRIEAESALRPRHFIYNK